MFKTSRVCRKNWMKKEAYFLLDGKKFFVSLRFFLLHNQFSRFLNHFETKLLEAKNFSEFFSRFDHSIYYWSLWKKKLRKSSWNIWKHLESIITRSIIFSSSHFKKSGYLRRNPKYCRYNRIIYYLVYRPVKLKKRRHSTKPDDDIQEKVCIYVCGWVCEWKEKPKKW